MPKTNNTDAADQEKADGSKPPSIPNKENSQDDISETGKSSGETKNEKSSIKWRRPIIRVNIPKEQDTAMLNETKRGNTVAIWGIIVSGLAVAATLITLWFVKESTNAAV